MDRALGCTGRLASVTSFLPDDIAISKVTEPLPHRGVTVLLACGDPTDHDVLGPRGRVEAPPFVQLALPVAAAAPGRARSTRPGSVALGQNRYATNTSTTFTRVEPFPAFAHTGCGCVLRHRHLPRLARAHAESRRCPRGDAVSSARLFARHPGERTWCSPIARTLRPERPSSMSPTPYGTRDTLARVHPDVVVLAAADAYVERFEKEPIATRKVNVEAARGVAENGLGAGCPPGCLLERVRVPGVAMAPTRKKTFGTRSTNTAGRR